MHARETRYVFHVRRSRYRVCGALHLAVRAAGNVEVIVDSPTACGPAPGGGAAARRYCKRTLDANAIIVKKNKSRWKRGSKIIKKSAWLRGNKAEQIIFGSQNWSDSGNDKTTRNLRPYETGG